MQHIQDTFFNLLKNPSNSHHAPSDNALATFLKAQLSGLSMFVPALHLTGTYKHTKKGTEYESPVYKVQQYKKYALGNDVGLKEFVTLFLAGAHFVVLHNAKDLGHGKVADFYAAFHKDNDKVLAANKVPAAGHSHYTSLVALFTAYGYPKIAADEAPGICPIVASFLIDTTANKVVGSDYNTFFQLEGWPGVTMGGMSGWHAADFATHQATKWNISTYGLCPYSEKRGTTIFLAPDNWTAPVTPGWKMPSYAGARKESPPWVATDSISGIVGGVL
ncbi:hypothetical protein ACN28S_08600 [Cystobacter fuscus]